MATLFRCFGILTILVPGVLSITNYYMGAECGKTITIDSNEQVHLSASQDDSRITCSVNFQTKAAGSRWFVHFGNMDIDYSDTYDCSSSFLTVSGLPDVQISDTQLCGLAPPSGYFASSGRDLQFYIQSDGNAQTVDFDVVLTPFQLGYCGSDGFKCANGRCFSNNISCSDYSLCGYSNCPQPTTTTTSCDDDDDCGDNAAFSTGDIIGITVAPAAFTILLTVVLVVCRRKRRLALLTQRRLIIAVATIEVDMTGDMTGDDQYDPRGCPPPPPPYTPREEEQTDGRNYHRLQE